MLVAERAILTALASLVICACGSTDSSSGASAIAETSTSPTTASIPATPLPTPTATPAPATPASSPPIAVPSNVAMPDAGLTPGETFTGVTTSQVCTPGYASSVRHVTTAQYHEVYAEYHIAYPQPSGTYELDHLIPLELGGDNANANLWPEPANPVPGFHQKDALENTMHGLVCQGRLDLGQAQREIAVNWYAAYRRYVAG
jgi:hypothetical protein